MTAGASNQTCGNHSWYVRVVDNAGNMTDSSPSNFIVSCGCGPIVYGSSGGGIYYPPSNSSVLNVLISTTSPTSPLISSVVSSSTTKVKLPVDDPYTFTRDLKYGSEGDDVISLQRILISKGFLSSGSDIGYFGPLTQKALIDYQNSMGIVPAVGYFGSVTKASFGQDKSQLETTTPTFSRSLGLGLKGEDVRDLQVFLNNLGFTVSISGAGSKGQETDYFVEATRSALVRFQNAHNIIPAVGYFGPITREKVRDLGVR